MAINALSKKEEKLKKLAGQIKNERRKLDEKLGKNIIAVLDLEYGDIDDTIIDNLCNILKEHYTSE